MADEKIGLGSCMGSSVSTQRSELYVTDFKGYKNKVRMYCIEQTFLNFDIHGAKKRNLF